MHYKFDNLYQRYKVKYMFSYGQAKFLAIERKIYSSSKLTELNVRSSNRHLAPTAKDFGATIQSIGYFMIANSDTSAMAQLIAIKRWDEEINSHYNLCTEQELYFKGESTLRQWSKL